jgi:hypothetical protein
VDESQPPLTRLTAAQPARPAALHVRRAWPSAAPGARPHTTACTGGRPRPRACSTTPTRPSAKEATAPQPVSRMTLTSGWPPSRTPAAPGEAALTLQCLRAEAAVRVGDAAAITALTSGVTTATATADMMVGARLAVAAVHGQRIAGHTKAALGIFPHVWDQGDGPPKVAAGLWACDLHMCQGLRVERENVRRPVIPRLHVRLRTSWPAGSRMYLRGEPRHLWGRASGWITGPGRSMAGRP